MSSSASYDAVGSDDAVTSAGFGRATSVFLTRVFPMCGSSGIWKPILKDCPRVGIHSMRKLPPVPNKPPRRKYGVHPRMKSVLSSCAL